MRSTSFRQASRPHNAFIERFDPTYLTEATDPNLSSSLAEGRAVTANWLPTHSTERPHDSPRRVLPLMFLPRPNQSTPPTTRVPRPRPARGTS